MYQRDLSFTMTTASVLTYSAAMTITTTDYTVEGSDAFTFTFTTASTADLIVI